MIVEEESDSEGEGQGTASSLRVFRPVVASINREKQAVPSSSPSLSHRRSPSLPVAPQVNVEEVDRPSGALSRPKPHHVKASSVDCTLELERRSSPVPDTCSLDSDSTCSRHESPQPGVTYNFRTRSDTVDSDTVLLSFPPLSAMPMEKRGSELSETGSLRLPRPTSRGAISEDSGEDVAAELANTENKLLYLTVARCIAYPFNAKYQLETAPPKPKLNEDRFRSVTEMLGACREMNLDVIQRSAVSLSGVEYKCLQSDRFQNCLEWYMDNVLEREDVVRMCKSGSFSVKELESIFKVLATKHITYTSEDQQLDTSELQTWCSMFRKLVEHSARGIRSGGLGHRSFSPTNENGGGTSPNREKLYKLFQKILHIKNIEHQILYKACQLGVREDQEAVVRRELHKREQTLKDKTQALMAGKFGSRRVEEIYREEELKHLKQLMANLDNLSLTSTGTTPQPQKKKKQSAPDTSGSAIPKQSLSFSLKLNVTVQELQQLTVPTEGKRVFCVFELAEGGNESLQTSLEHVSQQNFASFDVTGEFWTRSPIPEVRYTLRKETKGMFSDDRIIARRTSAIIPTPTETVELLDLYRSDKDSTVVGRLKVAMQLETPPNMRKCGYLYSQGESLLRQSRRRFFVLMQLNQYKFILCSYNPRDMHPRNMILLEQYTVDYMNEDESDQSDANKESLQHPYKFILISEEERLRFGCRDDGDRKAWVQWIYRATGQDFQPTVEPKGEKKSGTREQDRYGLSKVISQDISTVNFHRLFEQLFRAILDYRLREDVFSRGLFSPEQLYILDEFCARYGVRDPFRHFTCLREWVAREEEGLSIWPVMLLSSFRFCQMHVGGINPPEKKVIATREEQESLVQVSQLLEDLVIRRIEHFRSQFPFGCPKDDLKVTFKLFNLVTAMNHKGSGSNEDSPRSVLTLALERAALINYKQVFRQMETSIGAQLTPPLTFAQITDLAHFCIEYMYELHDFYWEDFTQVSPVFTSHINAFWMVFVVDLQETMAIEDNTLLKLRLFHTINQYFCSQPTMKLGKFHLFFLSQFTPVVIQYMEGLEAGMRDDLARGFAQESWMPVSVCCNTVQLALKALQSLRTFLVDLNWPEDTLATHLNQRVRSICVDRFQEAADNTREQLTHVFSSVSISLSSSLPLEVFTIINTLVFLNAQLIPICAPQDLPLISHDNKNIEDHIALVLQTAVAKTIDKLCDPLASILLKLGRYDPTGSVFTSLKNLITTSIPVSNYSHFVSATLDAISKHLVQQIFANFVMNWYECQLQQVNTWLEKRPPFSLHPEQLTAIFTLKEAIYSSFEACSPSISLDQLESEGLVSLRDRLRIEKSKDDLLGVGNK